MSKKNESPIFDRFVRYNLATTLAEAKSDFSPETGSQRLLKQSEISARFRKTARANRPSK